MKHVKRLVLVPEHMIAKKPLVPPLTAQVNHLNTEMDNVLEHQDMTQDKKAKFYDQTLQHYLTYYDKRMQKPIHVSMIPGTKVIDLINDRQIKKKKFNTEIEVSVLIYPLSYKSNPHLDVT